MKLGKYALMLLIQLLAMAAISFALFSTLFLSSFLYKLCSWAFWPILGAVSAYMVTVRGVNNYLAWLAPPLAGLAAHYLLFFYMPDSPGPFFICAFASIVGAATGDVVKKRSK